VLKLQPREVGAAIAGQSQDRTTAPDVSSRERYPWLDSSLDLMHGLDVVELSIEELARVFREPTRTLPKA
jgi:hypothetical protein